MQVRQLDLFANIICRVRAHTYSEYVFRTLGNYEFLKVQRHIDLCGGHRKAEDDSGVGSTRDRLRTTAAGCEDY